MYSTRGLCLHGVSIECHFDISETRCKMFGNALQKLENAQIDVIDIAKARGLGLLCVMQATCTGVIRHPKDDSHQPS